MPFSETLRPRGLLVVVLDGTRVFAEDDEAEEDYAPDPPGCLDTSHWRNYC
jgi:hypothetical protein